MAQTQKNKTAPHLSPSPHKNATLPFVTSVRDGSLDTECHARSNPLGRSSHTTGSARAWFQPVTMSALNTREAGHKHTKKTESSRKG